jgi:RNA polymerase sigma factor (sigma-70 family)
MIDDATLLRRYATERSEEAFAELVRRHLPLVYAAAVRRLGPLADRAGDVAQSVFIAAAGDAGRLARHPVLAGWLHTATRNAALDVIRSEKRRRAREQEAYLMQEPSSPTEAPADWARLRPAIDDAVDQLGTSDRDAVLLRFFQNRSFAEIAALLGVNEDAARKRVGRALDKLHATLSRRGITSTSVALATLLAGESAAAAAPTGLAATVTSAATASAAVVSTVAFMSLPKISVGIGVLLLGAGAIGLVSQRRTIADLRKTQDRLDEQVATLTRANTELEARRIAAVDEAARIRPESNGRVAPPHAPPAARSSAPASVPPSRAASPLPSRNTPEERARLHTRYDPFLQRLGLTPAQMDRFIALKIAIADAQADFQAAVDQTGAPVTEELHAMRGKLSKPMWDEIYELVGAANRTALSDYEGISAYRPFVAGLFQTSGIAISDEQTEQLTRLVIQHNHPVRVRPTDMASQNRIDWATIAHDAEPMLTPAQLAVVRDYAARQKSP